MSETNQEARRALTEKRGAELEKWWAINFVRFMNSLDPISPTLSDMPTEILDQVLEKLKPVDQLTSRKICRSLRAAVVQNGISFDSISFWVWDGQVEMRINKMKIIYTNAGNSIVARRKKKVVRRDNYMQLAFNDLEIVLKHVRKFEFVVKSQQAMNITTYFLNILKSKQYVHVKELSLIFVSPSDIISTLPYFDSRELKSIELWCLETIDDFEQLTRMDQWKKSRDCIVFGPFFNIIPIHYLFHFSNLEATVDYFSALNAMKIRNNLLERSSFQQCTFWIYDIISVEVARVFKPNYSGGDEYEFEYFNMHNKFLISCAKSESIGFSWKFIIRKCK